MPVLRMSFPFRYMVDAADQEKIEASKNELHNLLDKPQLQGIPVSCCLGGIPSPSATHTIPTATHTTSPLHSYCNWESDTFYRRTALPALEGRLRRDQEKPFCVRLSSCMNLHLFYEGRP